MSNWSKNLLQLASTTTSATPPCKHPDIVPTPDIQPRNLIRILRLQWFLRFQGRDMAFTKPPCKSMRALQPRICSIRSSEASAPILYRLPTFSQAIQTVGEPRINRASLVGLDCQQHVSYIRSAFDFRFMSLQTHSEDLLYLSSFARQLPIPLQQGWTGLREPEALTVFINVYDIGVGFGHKYFVLWWRYFRVKLRSAWGAIYTRDLIQWGLRG